MMLLTKEELLNYAWETNANVHFSKLFDTSLVNWYDYHLFHKMFKNFDNEIMFISTNESRHPVYKLLFFNPLKLKELFKLWNWYIKLLFKNDEVYLYLWIDNISKLGKDVVSVERIK